MTNFQKIAMAAGWVAAGFYMLAFKGSMIETNELRSEIELNKNTIKRANQIVTDAIFEEIIENNDL